MNTLPTIQTERLILRDLNIDDAIDMFEYTTDDRVSKYLLWLPHKNIQETEAAIKLYKSREQMMQWAITLKDTGKLIGVGGYGIVNELFKKVDLGFSFNPKFWNKGYATELTRALIRYGFMEMGLVRIQGAVHPDNPASSKVLEKCGLSYEATLKNWMYMKGESIDTLIYAITSQEYLTK